MTNDNEKASPFWQHLEELRFRFIKVAVLFILLCFGTFYFSDRIIGFLLAPMTHVLPAASTFIATDATTGWAVSFKVSLFSALYIIFPFVIFEIWRFLKPGLKSGERRGVLPVFLMLGVFFVLGGVFSYHLAMPTALKFLVGIYSNGMAHFMPELDTSITFVIRMLYGFGLLFETPFVLLALGASGMITVEQMTKARPYMIVMAFIVGAILTPPDIASQTMMALPFVVLYELGILMNRLLARKNQESRLR